LPTQNTILPEPLAVSKAEARRHCGAMGATKFDELIKAGRVKTTKVDGRVLVVYASLKALVLGEQTEAAA
jgi:hypothetical protein